MRPPADTPLVKPLSPHRGRNVWLHRALLFASVVVLVNALVGESGLAATLRARHEYGQAQARLAALQQENAALSVQARRLSDDPRMVEEVAREELGFIRPGEVMFVLKPVKERVRGAE